MTNKKPSPIWEAWEISPTALSQDKKDKRKTVMHLNITAGTHTHHNHLCTPKPFPLILFVYCVCNHNKWFLKCVVKYFETILYQVQSRINCFNPICNTLSGWIQFLDFKRYCCQSLTPQHVENTTLSQENNISPRNGKWLTETFSEY